ncbi:MAG: ABC transporter ATP-binding protein, partial [Clostridia bacterium]|nr:ABC transporter ATP-binding protein [Clostridia bacterium]
MKDRKNLAKGPGPMGPVGGLIAPVSKAEDFKGTLKRLVNYLRKERVAIIFMIVLAVIATLFNIFNPKILAKATNALQTGIMRGSINLDYIVKIILTVLSLYIVMACFHFFSGFIAAGVTQKIVYRMRRDIKHKLSKVTISYYDTNSTGDMMSRITNDVDTIANTLQQSLSQSITGVISIIGISIMMFTINVYMTLIALGTLPIFLTITMLIIKKSQKRFAAQQEKLGALNGYIEETFTGQKLVTLYGKENNAAENFENLNQQLKKESTAAQSISGMIMPMLQFVNNLGYVLVCVVGGILAGARNPLMIGDIQAFIQYMSEFGQPIMQTANIANTFQSTIAAAERVFRLLDAEEEPADSGEINPLTLNSDVAFVNTDFSYDKNKELIKDMNIKISSADRIAIVGPTGAGKTTLVNLLMRFYEIDSGSITIGGTDYRNLKKKDLRNMFGMVLQDTWLFSGTIRDNIAYGNPGISEEAIVEAAKKAHIDHYIRTLPDGYNT